MHSCIRTYSLFVDTFMDTLFFIMVSDSMTFILIRWFTAHPQAWERDNLCRPCCPGALRYNHCLWKYAKTPQPRRVMTNTDGSQSECFKRANFIFGHTERARTDRWQDEQYAYYGLITPTTVLSTVNMSQEYDSCGMSHTGDWLETVTVT